MITLFPTTLWQSKVSGEPSLSALEAACWFLEENDHAGHEWCEKEGYDGYTSYASLDDLPERLPEFAELKTQLDAAAVTFAESQHWDCEPESINLCALWVNILGEGAMHSGHIHPGSVISGTVYICVPKGAGRIKFEDPRLGFKMAAPQLRADAPADVKPFFYHTPQPGEILMWESWLRHEVMPSQCEEARISISFNYSYTP